MPDVLAALRRARVLSRSLPSPLPLSPPSPPFGRLVTLPMPSQLTPLDKDTSGLPAGGPEANVTWPEPRTPLSTPTDQGTSQPPAPIEPTDRDTDQGPVTLDPLTISPKRILELVYGSSEWANKQFGPGDQQAITMIGRRQPIMKRLFDALADPRLDDAYTEGLKSISYPTTIDTDLLQSGKASGMYYSKDAHIALSQQSHEGYSVGALRQTAAHELAHHIDAMVGATEPTHVDSTFARGKNAGLAPLTGQQVSQWLDAVDEDWIKMRFDSVGEDPADRIWATIASPSHKYVTEYVKDTAQRRGVNAALREDFADFTGQWMLASPASRRALEHQYPHRSALVRQYLQILIDRAQQPGATPLQPPSSTVVYGKDLPDVTSYDVQEHPSDDPAMTIQSVELRFARAPTPERLQEIQQMIAQQQGWQPVRATPIDAGGRQYFLTFGPESTTEIAQ